MISVIITIYNREKTLRRAIDSYLAQSYLEKELILIDDGSTDSSSSIAKEYLDFDNVIYYYQDNKGAASAKNKGVELSSGDYISFLDSDDYYSDPETLNKVSKKLDAYDFVSFEKINIVKNKVDYIDYYKVDDINNIGLKKHMLKSPLNYAGHNPYTFNKQKFIDAGLFDESASWGDALKFWRCFFSQDIKSFIISDCGYVYDQTEEGSVSRDKSRKKNIIAYKVILDTYLKFEADINNMKYHKVWLLILLIQAIKGRDAYLSINTFFKWFVGNPFLVVGSVFYVFRTKVLKC